jgi:hypothetical protein
MSTPTAGYAEASKRAEEARKQEDARRQAEAAAKQEAINHSRTPGYVSSRDQPQARAPGVNSTSDYLNASQLREVKAAGESARQREKARQEFNPITLREDLKVEKGQVVSTRFDPSTGTSISRIRDPRPTQPTPAQQQARAFAESRAMRRDERAAERSFVRGLASEAGGREFGYTISKNEMRGTIYPETRRRAADVAVGIGAEDPRFEGVAKLAGDELQVTRQYEVFLEDTISGRPPPGKRHYQVFLEDRLSGGPYAYERSPGETKTIGLPDDPVQAFVNPIENIYTQYVVPGTKGIGVGIGALFGGKPDRLVKETGRIGAESAKAEKPEVAGAFFEDIIIPVGQRGAGNLVSVATSGRQARGTTEFVNKEFAAFQRTLEKEKPASVAASIAGTAVAFLPDAILKGGGRAARFVGGLFGTAGKAERASIQSTGFVQAAKRFDNTRINLGTGTSIIEKQAQTTFRPVITTRKVTTLKDIDTRLKDLGKDFSQAGRSGQSTVLVKPQKTVTFKNVTIPLNIEKSSVKIGTVSKTRVRAGLRSSEAVKLGIGTGQVVSVKAIVKDLIKPLASQTRLSGTKALRAGKIRQSDIVKELEAQAVRTVPIQRAKAGVRQRVEQIPGLQQQLNAAQKFKFDQLFRQNTLTLSSTRTRQLTRTQLREFGISELLEDVITKPPVRNPLGPPSGRKRQIGKRRKGRDIQILRGFKAGSLPLAFLGPRSTLARDFEKTFGDLY